MRFRSFILSAGLIASASFPAWSADYYVAPIGAEVTCSGDGTLKCPWSSIDSALNSQRISGGDTILLMDGDHGPLRTDAQFISQVTIQSQNGKRARIENADFGMATNIRLKDLSIWRNEGDGTGPLVRAGKESSNLTFEGLDMRSRKDATDYLKWDSARWLAVAGNGFDLRGSNYVIRNNTITGVRIGISAGSRSIVEDNVVDGFSGDGMKGVGDSTFRYNLVKNRIKIDKYHSDGFQAYTKTVIKNLTLESNVIIQWAGPKDYPLRGWLQGIGLFDGFYENLLIQNNLVVVEHSHGLSVYGTRHAKILNNTVVNLTGRPNKYPMIRVKKHKDGRPSEDVLVANNLAMKFEGGDPANTVIFENNSIISNPVLVFTDVARFDYLPRSGSGFIDTGLPVAPAVDLRNHKRPAGTGPDRGAYETGSSPADETAVAAPTGDPATWVTP